MVKCSVCRIDSFAENAHVRARHKFRENEFHMYQNILPICPNCHYFFDKKAFTLHHDWKCWVFSDFRQFETSSSSVKNPYRDFLYAYPPEEHTILINQISEQNILSNQDEEFRNNTNKPAKFFFRSLKMRLQAIGRWHKRDNRPKQRFLDTTMKCIDGELD